jgi:hypothetical protein
MIIETREKFRVIKADEGFVLTTYTNEDIRDYSSFDTCYVPLNSDISYIREITIEEDARLTEERNKALEYD